MSPWEAYVLCLIGGVMVGAGAHSLWFEGPRLEYIMTCLIGLVFGWWGMSL